MHRALTAILISIAAAACSGARDVGVAQDSTFDGGATLEFGEGLVRGKPDCKSRPVRGLGELHEVSLPQNAGAISLPAEFTPYPSKNPEYQEWRAPDRASVSAWVTNFPTGGMATSGGGRVHVEQDSSCVLTIAGRRSLLDGVRLWMQADTNYHTSTPVFVTTGVVVNFGTEAFTRARSDELVALLNNVKLKKR